MADPSEPLIEVQTHTAAIAEPPPAVRPLADSLPNLNGLAAGAAPSDASLRDAVAALQRAEEMISAHIKRSQQLIDSSADLPDLLRAQVERMGELSLAIHQTQQSLARRGLSDEQLARRLEPLYTRIGDAIDQTRSIQVRLDHIDDRLGAQETSLARRLEGLAGHLNAIQLALRRTRRRLTWLITLTLLLAAGCAIGLVLSHVLK
jgi:chromosome segregation ATPase